MNVLREILYLSIFFIVVNLATTEFSVKDTVKVLIPQQGSVLGSVDETSWTKQKFFSFRGIPYAESPSGNLRFKPPKARSPWNTTFDARNFGKPCPSNHTVANVETSQPQEDLEDCLSLNVYSKNINSKLPVMFFTHGGAFSNSSASMYPPHFLMEKDIVLVVVQYRIGALGFMTTLTEEMPGNVPIMDLLMALGWVQKNIHVFGGDPDNVTIFGQSAGAGMTSALVLSPKTPENYFKRSIMQSSTMMAPWCVNREPLQQVKRICEAIGCENCNEIRKQYECLMNADVVKLAKVASWEMFAPVVGDVHGIIPEEPKNLLDKFNRTIPLMTGFTKHDGSFLLAKCYDIAITQYGSISNLTVRQFANMLVDMGKDNTDLSNNLFLNMFFKQEVLDTYNHDAVWPAYFDIANDVNIKSPIIAYARGMQRLSIPVYLYSFDYAGETTLFDLGENASQYPFEGGVRHSIDVINLFPRFSLNAEDTEFAKKLVNLFYSFAVNGDPNLVTTGITIKPMETESGPYFHIDKNFTLDWNVLKELTSTLEDPDNRKLIKSTERNNAISQIHLHSYDLIYFILIISSILNLFN